MVSSYNKYSTATTAYKQEGILTASPVELVVMLYDELVKQLKIAKICIENKSIEKANNALKLSGDIVVELTKGLDFNYGISRDLMALYDFMLNDIYKANAFKDMNKIEEVLEVANELRAAWVEIKSSSAVRIATILED